MTFFVVFRPSSVPRPVVRRSPPSSYQRRCPLISPIEPQSRLPRPASIAPLRHFPLRFDRICPRPAHAARRYHLRVQQRPPRRAWVAGFPPSTHYALALCPPRFVAAGASPTRLPDLPTTLHRGSRLMLPRRAAGGTARAQPPAWGEQEVRRRPAPHAAVSYGRPVAALTHKMGLPRRTGAPRAGPAPFPTPRAGNGRRGATTAKASPLCTPPSICQALCSPDV